MMFELHRIDYYEDDVNHILRCKEALSHCRYLTTILRTDLYLHELFVELYRFGRNFIEYTDQ